MAQTQMIEGTTEEVLVRLRENFPSQKLRVFVEPEEQDLGADLLNAPNVVRDEAHLIGLLLDGVHSLVHEVTNETWEQRRQEVHRRHASASSNAQNC